MREVWFREKGYWLEEADFRIYQGFVFDLSNGDVVKEGSEDEIERWLKGKNGKR